MTRASTRAMSAAIRLSKSSRDSSHGSRHTNLDLVREPVEEEAGLKTGSSISRGTV